VPPQRAWPLSLLLLQVLTSSKQPTATSQCFDPANVVIVSPAAKLISGSLKPNRIWFQGT